MMPCEKPSKCRIPPEVRPVLDAKQPICTYLSVAASIFDIQGADVAQLLATHRQGEHTTEFKRSDLYLEKTIEPKVFMPFYTAPHTLPRKVEIER